ncbi:MAG: helix-turn-helix transcriptional regulator [bacterium]|nr:helix-turn-helix transcriptional regulator [bacterium]
MIAPGLSAPVFSQKDFGGTDMPKYNPNPTPLEKARRAAGLTRKQLAEQSHVSMDTIKNYEQKSRKINVKQVLNIVALADALDVPVQKILMPDGGGDDA